MRKVKIKKVPKLGHGGKTYGDQTPPTDATANPSLGSYDGGNDPEIKVKHTLEPTSRENSNLEAELGETVITNLQQEGIPEFYKIGGKRHYNGGTPLNLPPNSFIFSRDKKLAIKNEEVLNMFGKTMGKKRKSYTPADLSKSYDLNKYREILINPSSDHMQRETAELMIQNYNVKLGALSLVQESMKGMEDGIPAVAMPYLETMGVDPASLVGPEAGPQQAMQQAAHGGQFKSGGGTKRKMRIKKVPMYQDGGDVATMIKETGIPPYTEAEWFSPQGVKRLNMMRKEYGLKSLTGDVTEDAVRKGVAETQNVADAQHPVIIRHYMKYGSHQPNKKLIELAKAKGVTIKTKADLLTALKNGKLASTDLNEGFKDQKWWYRMPRTQKEYLTPDAYKTQMEKKPDVTEAEHKYFVDTTNPDLYKEYYTDEPAGKPADKTVEDIKTVSPDYQGDPRDPKAKFWKQDMVNMRGAAGDLLGLKKYSPWQAEPMFEEARPTFTDFRGTANRIQAQAQGATDAAKTFAGPQAYAAMAANIQAGAIDPILKAQEAENATNVAIANQFEMANTQAKNQFNVAKANLDTKFYDKTVIANQAFDNSKRALRKNLRDSFNQGWTNRGMTQTMNEMRPQWSVDPSTGFTKYTGAPTEINPSGGGSGQGYENQVSSILSRHPDWTPQEAMALLKNQQAGITASMKNRPNQSVADYADDYPRGYPGGTQTRGRKSRSSRGRS